MTIRQAQRRRRQLLAQNRRSESRRLAESSVTTMMLVAVVGVFLLVEFPLAVLGRSTHATCSFVVFTDTGTTRKQTQNHRCGDSRKMVASFANRI